MSTASHLAEIAALVGDPARANILSALLGGRALTAGELAYAAHVTPQTASAHLARLVEARLLLPDRQGRHRYFRLAAPEVARMLEGIMAVAAPPRHRPRSRQERELRLARTCYDHLAGLLGVALTDALAARRHIVLDPDGGEVTSAGTRFFDEFGLDLGAAARRRRRFCRPCLDWTERRPHLGGAVGAGLAERCFALGWIARVRDSRAVAITQAGREGLERMFAITLPTAAEAASPTAIAA